MSAGPQVVDGSKPLAGYLRPQDLAKLLQVSTKSVYRWAQQDPTMPALRIGGLVRFPQDRILAWLRSREQGPGKPRQSRKQVLTGVEGAALRVVGDTDPASCAQACAHEGLK